MYHREEPCQGRGPSGDLGSEGEVELRHLACCERHTQGAWAESLQEARIAPLSLFDHFDGRQQILARRQATNLVARVLVQSGCLDVPRLWSPTTLVDRERDDREVGQRRAVPIVEWTTPDSWVTWSMSARRTPSTWRVPSKSSGVSMTS